MYGPGVYFDAEGVFELVYSCFLQNREDLGSFPFIAGVSRQTHFFT